MALNQKLSNRAVNAKLDALTALLNGGMIKLYDGAQPATVDTAVSTQHLLATLTLASPAFGAAVAGVAAANAIGGEADAPEPGVNQATWFRAYDAIGNAITDGSVGTSNANMVLNGVNVQQHGTVNLDGWSLTERKE